MTAGWMRLSSGPLGPPVKEAPRSLGSATVASRQQSARTSRTPCSVLITDGNERASLAAARALVAAGFEVYVTAPARLCLAGVSRCVHHCVVHVDPLVDPSGYAAEIGQRAAELGIRVLLPVTDPAVDALLDHRHALPSDVVVPFPDRAAYRVASDKLQLLELARAAGFGIPKTLVIRCPAEGATIRDTGLFPGVLKPHRSVVAVGRARCKVGVSFVADVESCHRAVSALPSSAFPLLLQHRVAGPGEGLFVLRWDGRPLAVFAHRRLREKPPAGGVSVYRESILPDPGLVESGLRLLDALEWRGVAMVECKRDPTTGRHVIMEVNGRFWGSLQLAIDAGVDFPTLLVRCALGQDVPAQGPYRVGVRSRWFWGDLDHLYLRLTRSAAALQLDAPSASRLRALVEFFRFRPERDRSEVWRWRDPAPFVFETLQRLGVA